MNCKSKRRPSFRAKSIARCALALSFVFSVDGYATQWIVNSTADTNTSGTFRYAIANAVSGDTINFSLANNSTITLTTHLPVITQSALTIDNTAQGSSTGASSLTINGANSYMIFFVYGGSSGVTINGSNGGMTLTGGLSRGGAGGNGWGGGGGAMGAGGALLVNNTAQVTITDLSFNSNGAQGGVGGVSSFGGAGAGGAGMLGGNGGTANANYCGGAGGGGLGATAPAGAAAGSNGIAGTSGLIPGAGLLGGAAGGINRAGGAGSGGGGGSGGGYSTVGAAGGNNAGSGATAGSGNGGIQYGGTGGGGGLSGQGGNPGVGYNGGNAGDFGGGGGMGYSGTTAGNGGFGGGGGGAGTNGTGGIGGYGGGGGGSDFFTGGSGGFGGGSGATHGGGGGALGGAVFVRQGGSLTIQNSSQNPNISSNTVTPGAAGGTGATAGSAYGSGIFLQGSNTLTFKPAASQTITFSDVLGDEAGNGGSAANKASLTLNGSGTLLLSNANKYAGTTTVTSGSLTANNNAALGTSTLAFNGGTLQQTSGGTISLSNPVTVSSNNGTIGGSNNITLSGNGTLTGSLTSSNSAITTIGGVMNSTGSYVNSAGTTIFNGTSAHTYSGGTSITGGTLQTNTASVMPATGAVSVGASGTFNLNGYNQTIGDLSGSGDINLGTGTLTLGTSTASTTFSGIFANTGGSLIKQGSGNLILTGANTYAGTTTVTSGRLSVNGSIQSPVTVGVSGTLGGSGTVIGTVTNNGTVSPGNSIGTLTINGNYNPSATATTSIEINPQGQCSVLNISGSANLNGFLNINADAGNYSPNVTYQFLNAGTIHGDFGGFTSMVGPYRVGVAPAGDSPGIFEISFTINPIATQLTSAPATASSLAQYLDSLPTPAVGSDLGDNVIGPISNLLSGSALNQALNSISPARTASSVPITQSTSTLVNGIIGARLSFLRNSTAGNRPSHFADKSFTNPLGYLNLVTGKPTRTQLQDFSMTESGLLANAKDHIQPLMQLKQTGLWVYGFGNRESLKDTDTNTGFKAKTGGYTLGLDHAFKDFILGAGLGKAVSLVHLNEASGSNRLDNTFINFYGSYAPNNWYLDASLTTGRVCYETNQVISFLTLNRTAVGKHYGFQFTPHLGAGYEFKLPLAHLTPFINLDYSSVYEQGYQTIGADSLNQSIANTRSALLRAEYGIKLSKTRRFCHCSFTGKVIPSLNLSWINKRVIKQGNLTSNFVGQPGSFTIDGYNQNSKHIAPGLGLAFHYDNGGFISTQLNSEMGQGYRNYEATLKVGLVF